MAGEPAEDGPTTRFNSHGASGARCSSRGRTGARSSLSVVLLLVLAASSLLVPLVIRHTIDHYLPAFGRRRGASAIDRDAARAGRRAGRRRAPRARHSSSPAMRYSQIRVINATGQRVIHDLRMAVFRHITTRSLRFFDKSPVGRLVTRTTHDVESAERAVRLRHRRRSSTTCSASS